MIRWLVGIATAFLLAVAAEESPAGRTALPIGWAAVAVAAPCLLLVGAFALWKAARRGSPGLSPSQRLAETELVLVLLGHAAFLFLFGWGNWVLDELGWRARPREALVLLAAPAGMLALWLAPFHYAALKGFLEPELRGGIAVWLLKSLRLAATSAAGLILLVFPILAVELASGSEDFSALYPCAAAGLLAPGLVALFGLSPWLLRFAIPMGRLPPEMLGRLLDLASRARVKVGAVRTADTAPWTANASALGWIPGTNLVVLGRRFGEMADASAVEAVFAHELGHIRLRHGLLNLAALLGLVFLFASVLSLSRAEIPRPFLAALILLAWLFWFLLASRFGRSFEVEADLFAAGILGENAYAKGMRAAGTELGSWRSRDRRHPALQERAALVTAVRESGDAARQVERSARARRLELAAATIACAAIFLAALGVEIQRTPEEILFESARLGFARARTLEPLLSRGERAASALGAPRWLVVPRETVGLAYRRAIERAETALKRSKRAQDSTTGFDSSILEAPASTSRLKTPPAEPSGR